MWGMAGGAGRGGGGRAGEGAGFSGCVCVRAPSLVVQCNTQCAARGRPVRVRAQTVWVVRDVRAHAPAPPAQ